MSDLKAAQYDIMQRMRAGEGLSYEDFGIIKAYAKQNGGLQALTDYATIKRYFRHGIHDDTQTNEFNVGELKGKLTAIAAQIRAHGRMEDRLEYVRIKRQLGALRSKETSQTE